MSGQVGPTGRLPLIQAPLIQLRLGCRCAAALRLLPAARMPHGMSGSLTPGLRAALVGATASCRLLSTLKAHLLLQACRRVNARQVAVQALERATELGIYERIRPL